MNNQGNPGQPPPFGQSPGQPPGSQPGTPPPAPPYGQPPGGSYAPPPAGGAPYGGWPPQSPPAYPPPPGAGAPYSSPPQYGIPPMLPPGQAFPPGAQPVPPYSLGPPPAQPPFPGAQYCQPPYGAPATAPKRRVAPWIIVVAALGALLILGIIGAVVRYATLTPAVNKIEFAHNFQNNKAVDVTDTFKSTDPDLYAIIHLNTTKGTPNVKVVWTVVNATDANKRPVTGQEFGQVEKAATSTLLYASVSRGANPWPIGQYKAEIFLDGKLAKTASFTVMA